MHRPALFPLIGMLACVLAACVSPVGPDYHQPAEAVGSQPAAGQPFVGVEEVAARGQGGTPPVAGDALPIHWWRLYSDPQLDKLVQQALAHNTDLRQAEGNLAREHEVDAEVVGGRLPRLAVEGGPSYGHVSGESLGLLDTEFPSTANYELGASLSYQLDLFGQIRRAIETAGANTQASEAALELVRVNVAAGTARAYAEICSTGLRLQIARRSVALQQQSLDVTEQLHRAGRTGGIDTDRARVLLQQLSAAVPPLEAARKAALYRLAALTGALPRDFPSDVAACTVPPRVTGTVPVGDGAALLRRRPDVRQAERMLAAATARIGVATADLYPKVTLGLSASSAGLASRFGNSDAFAWSVGPLISWTVPNTGLAQARIAQAKAGTRAALAKFDGTVLTALREVETALDAYAHELDRRRALQTALDASAKVMAEARLLYRNGRTGYLGELDAERSLAGDEAALAASEARLSDDQVLLFLALGGGWEPDEQTTGSAQDTGSTQDGILNR